MKDNTVCAFNTFGFILFEFKIRLIRLDLSFHKQKFLYLNSQPTDSQES